MKNNFAICVLVCVLVMLITACGYEKISYKKVGDVDFTVVSQAEMTDEVKQIVDKRKKNEFKVTYSDGQYTYIIVGYGKQKYEGYSIKVKKMYETKNAICVTTQFDGPKKYSNKEVTSYPYIVIKIQYTDKNIVFAS